LVVSATKARLGRWRTYSIAIDKYEVVVFAQHGK
jgi:hypothetical protein